MLVRCVKCDRYRSTKYMQQAVFLGREDSLPPFELADAWKCMSTASCKEARKKCPKCGHLKRNHTPQENWFGGRKNITACITNMGMGDPCGCEHHHKEN